MPQTLILLISWQSYLQIWEDLVGFRFRNIWNHFQFRQICILARTMNSKVGATLQKLLREILLAMLN